MNMFKYIPVPEVVWLIAILIAKYIVGINTSGRYNDFIENSTWIIPALILFIIWLIHKGGIGYSNYFILRLFISSVILGHYFYTYWATAYTPQGPGSGTIYIIGMMMAIVLSLVYILVYYLRKT